MDKIRTQDVSVWEDFSLKPLPSMKESTKLRNFQAYSVFQSLQNNDRPYVLGLPTGSGKTITSYASYEFFKTVYPNTKLIVCTKKSAILQFEKEYYKFFKASDNYRSHAIHDRMPRLGEKSYPKARKKVYEMFSKPFNDEDSLTALVMNYPIFRTDFDSLYDAVRRINANGDRVFLILDEAIAFQNLQSQTSKCIDKMCKIASKVVAMTATITKGKLEVSYNMFKGVGIMLSENKAMFYEEFCHTYRLPNNPKAPPIITGYKNIGRFNERITPHCTILRKSEIDKYLPHFIPKVVSLPHTKDQFNMIRDIYNGRLDTGNYIADPIERDRVGEVIEMYSYDEEGEPIKNPTEQGYIKRVLQDPRLVTKASLNDTSKKMQSPKTEEILRMLEEDFVDEKVIIYTPSKVYVKILQEAIESSTKIPEMYRKVGVIHGDVDSLTREEYANQFTKSDDMNIMIINNAGSEAINLQVAKVLIIASEPDEGGDLIQIAGRLSRIGSRHASLLIIHLLMEFSQDEDECLIINQQLLLLSKLGQEEQGLIDYDYLEEHSVSGFDIEADVELESKDEIVYSKRKKRKSFYR